MAALDYLLWNMKLLLGFVMSSCIIAQSADHWRKLGRDQLQRALNMEMNQNEAKNVILFLGDGLDVLTATASRIFKGQLKGQTGEEGSLVWDTFPHVALSKTYNIDSQVADSAGTATAFLTGVKTKIGAIGYDDKIETSNCSSEARAERLASILEDSIAEAKSTGIVTTARLTHATPAAGYAHSADRNWESDSNLPGDAVANNCTDIAAQLIDFGLGLRVALGGGRRAFFPVTSPDPEYPGKTGNRHDGRNLTDEWLSERVAADMVAEYVWNLDDFNSVNPTTTDALLGLFEPSHMQFEKNRASDGSGEPSIAEMTEKAIRILRKDEDGFFLLVEAGRIDHGHHDGVAYSALTETLAFEAAVERALSLVDTDDTLIIVTGDHGHVMTMAGYPSRGNPILGLSDRFVGDDGLPYTTLGYMNGYGFGRVNQSFHETGTRPNLTGVDTENPSFRQDALVPLYLLSETHGGQDVPIYAIGPMAHLFQGVQEQSYIAHVMKYASCVGENQGHCRISFSVALGLRFSCSLMLTMMVFKWLLLK